MIPMFVFGWVMFLIWVFYIDPVFMILSAFFHGIGVGLGWPFVLDETRDWKIRKWLE